MAAIRDLTRNYLREARAHAGEELQARIDWLENKRRALSKELDEGGQAVLSSSFKGQSSSMDAGVSARDRLRAVNAAIDKLTGEGSGGGSLIIPQFSGIPL